MAEPRTDHFAGADPIAEVSVADARGVDHALRGEASALRAPDPAAPGIIRQILEQIQIRNGTVDVTLSPEELGRLTLSMTTTESTVNITISADRAETLDLLRRHAELLHQEARAAGFGSVTFGFSEHSGHGQGGDAPSQSDPPASASAQSASETAGTMPARTGPASTLDLRL